MKALPIELHLGHGDPVEVVSLSEDDCFLLRCVVLTEFMRSCSNISKSLGEKEITLTRTGTGVRNESLGILYNIEDGFDYRRVLFQLLNTMEGMPMQTLGRSRVTIGFAPITKTMQENLLYAVEYVLVDPDCQVIGYVPSPPMYRRNALTRLAKQLKNAISYQK
jgi:hypothetical protein